MRDSSLSVSDFRLNSYTGHDGRPCLELYIDCSFDAPPCRPSFIHRENCFMRVSGNTARLRVPVIEGELKRFYENPDEYYYLPAEDMAVHRSVAEFVDRKRRRKATVRNCYTRYEGLFLPQWSDVFSPVFKRNYNDSGMYFLYTEEWAQKSAARETYAAHVVRYLVSVTSAD